MFSVRIHGRGGQGVVTAAELLSVAANASGRYAQAFPSFGSERTGAPVVAFCRIDDRPIRLREPVLYPDALIVQDVTLLRQVDVFAGLATNGYVLLNAKSTPAQLGLTNGDGRVPEDRLVVVPATQLALTHVGRPVPNAALLGAFAALTGLITLGAVSTAICERFPGPTGMRNTAAAEAAFDLVRANIAGHEQEVPVSV
jgi:pyruvate ferredoxin oxidoreductase gamma subunit